MSKKDNVIWTVEGQIKEGQKDDLLSLMAEMCETVEKEPGTHHYEWTLSTNDSTLHVYERYKDFAAAKAHLPTWGKFSDRFTAAVEITKFVVYSNLDDELKDAVAGLNPVYMAPIGGFAKD